MITIKELRRRMLLIGKRRQELQAKKREAIRAEDLEAYIKTGWHINVLENAALKMYCNHKHLFVNREE